MISVKLFFQENLRKAQKTIKELEKKNHELEFNHSQTVKRLDNDKNDLEQRLYQEIRHVQQKEHELQVK